MKKLQCTLTINNEGLPTQFYDVAVDAYRIDAQTQAVSVSQVNSFRDNKIKVITDFMAQQGVDRSEIDFALSIMEEKCHNTAHFGWYGSFICSEYTGVYQ
jgi:hypothetical protein